MKLGTNYLLSKPQQSSPSFGALYMPNKQALVKMLDAPLAAEVEKERPFLKNLAKSIDIIVDFNKKKREVIVYVRDVMQPFIASGGIISKTLAEIKYKKQVNAKPHLSDTVPFSFEDLGYRLYAKALSLKIQYNKTFRPISVADLKTPTPYMKAS